MGIRLVAAVAMLGWLGGPAALAAAEIRVAGEQLPAVLERLEPREGLLALALGPNARTAAAAYPDPRRSDRSALSIVSLEGAAPIEAVLPGVARALVFSPDGADVFALIYRPARKRTGDAHLVRVGLGEGRARTVMRVPATARGLDYSPARDALLVASHNELRTVLLDGLRSGPLFRIVGDNRAVAALASSDIVLVGQADGILVVDLGDPPGENGTAPRDRAALPAGAVALAAERDGRAALAQLEDGSVFRVRVSPLAVEAAGSALVLAAPGKSDSRTPLDLAAPAPAPSPTPAASPLPPSGGPDAVSPAPPPDPVQAEAIEAAPPSEAPQPARPGAEEAPAKPPPMLPAEPGRSQLWGRLLGAAAAVVEEVVLLGPDSIVREAARVRPGPDGIWRANGLPAGRYQVQLAAGGNRLLVSEPRVAVVEVTRDGSTRAADFDVLRAFSP